MLIFINLKAKIADKNFSVTHPQPWRKGVGKHKHAISKKKKRFRFRD